LYSITIQHVGCDFIANFVAAAVTFDQGNEINLISSTPVLKGGDSLQLEWAPNLFNIGSKEDSASILVDIQLYRYDRLHTQWQVMTELASEIQNTGNSIVAVPATVAIRDPQLVVIKVSPSSQQDQKLTDANIAGWSRLAYTESGESTLQKLCVIWQTSERKDFGTTLLERLLPCPPNIAIARLDPQYGIDNTAMKYLEFFHPNASQCFHQAAITR